jgi:hypothetical protein
LRCSWLLLLQEQVVVDRWRDHCSLDEAIAVPETTTLKDFQRAGAADYINAETHPEAEMATAFRSIWRTVASDLAVCKGIRTNFQNCPADDSGADGTE